MDDYKHKPIPELIHTWPWRKPHSHWLVDGFRKTGHSLICGRDGLSTGKGIRGQRLWRQYCRIRSISEMPSWIFCTYVNTARHSYLLHSQYVYIITVLHFQNLGFRCSFWVWPCFWAAPVKVWWLMCNIRVEVIFGLLFFFFFWGTETIFDSAWALL